MHWEAAPSVPRGGPGIPFDYGPARPGTIGTVVAVRNFDAVRYIWCRPGVGGVVGAQLFKADQDVVMIARGEHLQAMQAHGLRYETPFADERLTIPVVGHPGEVDLRPDDVFLMTMKSQHTSEAFEELRWVHGDGVCVVCCQNGGGQRADGVAPFRIGLCDAGLCSGAVNRTWTDPMPCPLEELGCWTSIGFQVVAMIVRGRSRQVWRRRISAYEPTHRLCASSTRSC